MNDFIKNIPIIAFSIVFVVSVLVAMFGAGKILNQGFSYYLDAIPCSYYQPVPVNKERLETPTCTKDTTPLKQNLADGLAMFIVSAPLAYILFKQLKKETIGKIK